ncbi:ArsR/SmtB family transcription factor [Streptomyces mashuensis]|uniref:ArsR/SmtB family transcription factor n=1 Tax=Streptomyces mashuensis TaxID=33904 RepID=UPI001E547860|nr:metalloregulator ArsR/SmtB family transcription factor [Streptomyces mashuensis]
MTSTSAGPGDPAPEVLQEAAAVFGLLASPVRLHILWLLAQGEHNVTSLAERVGHALPAVSQHLGKLRLAGLVDARRAGRHTVYFASDPAVGAMVEQVVGGAGEPSAPPRRLRSATA